MRRKMAVYYLLVSVQMPPQGLMFARVVLHSLCTVSELAFFCWFGSEVMHKVTTSKHWEHTCYVSAHRIYSILQQGMLHTQPISVAVLSQALAFTRLIGGIADSNSAESMDFNLLCRSCVVNVAASAMSLSLVQRSPTGCGVCLCVCVSNCVWSRNLNNEPA
jgi:hypothetical protein